MTRPENSPYAMKLDDLVSSVRVAPEEQVIEEAEPRADRSPAGGEPPQLPNLAAGT